MRKLRSINVFGTNAVLAIITELNCSLVGKKRSPRCQVPVLDSIYITKKVHGHDDVCIPAPIYTSKSLLKLLDPFLIK